ncbi:MAG TPA: cobalt-precorrin-6A reductase [Rhodospirillaceae bacterium]|nr:cobalt-precorrin-6A reductase [Rhodospirillaceae bacterium]HIJ63005.1 cobalt-precorrin-6A reductase [Rhodospirillaceae bacterium]
MRDRVLILGGTGEAAALAGRLHRQGLQVITSLAGRLAHPPALEGAVRIGGFGGVAGLADFLVTEKISRVIDATHPFAATISAHARAVCRQLGLPLERLERPVWPKRPGDRWFWATDMAMAARMAPKLGRRIFLTVGAGSLVAFTKFGGPFYLIRLMESPAVDRPLFPRQAVLVDGGPFQLADEKRLLRHFAIDLLVSKQSGGPATAAKITAARQLGIPVLLIRRPWDAADGCDPGHKAGCR